MPDSYSINGMATHMDALLAEMRTTLGRMTEETFRPTAGRGLAAHGRVRATVGDRGHLTELVIDGHWLSSVDNQTLVKAVKEAVCGAVDDVHEQIENLPPITEHLDEMVEVLDRTLDEISNDLARAVGGTASL
ncbi:YbaB/EbfC family nucleoid-associated protein [Plantactinospora soyae]|uniref:DNA-binding protein YbaB n=1 Tax=Plantactinospora soyae TaxID=1544732 RepID=A0A927M3Z3_9ACTN|nr:YbaB/EbfC family nucleoid-associated protein [Plantactinospora soyae]MBE1487569.1 DNA-binding protein YbaB [Plantactinospora soyae]